MSEDHLEESWMREQEAHQVDRGQSNPNTDEDGDVIMEGAQESGPTGAEATGPPIPMVSTQEAEHAMDVDIGDMPQLTSEEATTVTPEEDDVLTATPPQWLERWPGYRSPLAKVMSLRMVKPSSRSCPPLRFNEVLHMSPLNSLNRRRKNEDLGTMGWMPRQERASLVIMSLYSHTRSG